MPGYLQGKVGALTSTPQPFAAASDDQVAKVVNRFVVEELGVDEMASPQQKLDEFIKFAARRAHNYVRNWDRIKRRNDAQDAIARTNILDDEGE